MILAGTMEINSKGHLAIGGCDTVDLAKQFGTPLFVMDEELVRNQCRQYVNALKKHYPKGMVLFAGKAFLTLAMARLLHEENMGLDVVSGGELFTALSADFPPERIYFHGNNKSTRELIDAIKLDVGRIVVDSIPELKEIVELAAQFDVSGLTGKREGGDRRRAGVPASPRPPTPPSLANLTNSNCKRRYTVILRISLIFLAIPRCERHFPSCWRASCRSMARSLCWS